MERFGPYRLIQRLAVGGMAEVFLAEPEEEPEAVPLVVKRIRSELLHRADIVEMFFDEVRISSLLHHPNIVQVRDFGDVDGVQYIAMEFVDGVSLSRFQRSLGFRALPVPLACWIVAQACAGLGYAHRRTVTYSAQPLGIVHRDISPQNILLSRQGQVKLADFGVAKADMRLTKTDPGLVKGKYAYMSPEHCCADRIVDHRADIFSVGAVLYEATTGSQLFGAVSTAEILDGLLEHRYTPPEQRVPGYPSELADIVNRALRWDPEQRYQDALEMQRDLVALLPPGYCGEEELGTLVQRCVREARPRTVPAHGSGRLGYPDPLATPTEPTATPGGAARDPVAAPRMTSGAPAMEGLAVAGAADSSRPFPGTDAEGRATEDRTERREALAEEEDLAGLVLPATRRAPDSSLAVRVLLVVLFLSLVLAGVAAGLLLFRR